jgi:hypothetical protein
MRNVTHNSITIILLISVLFFFSKKDPLNNDVNFKKNIIEFITAEDSREIKKILTFYQFPILNYWNEKNLSKNNLKEIYLSSWNKNEFSKNEIQSIKEISKYQYLLTTKYDYTKSLKNKSINSILSEIQFTFNKEGKITSIKNSSIRKVTKEDNLNPNYINELIEKEGFRPKNSLFLKSSLLILLSLNIILQVLFNIKKLIRKKKSSNTSSIKKQEIKSNKYHTKDLKYEEEFNKLLKEEEEQEKKKQESTKYHYTKLNNEEKFNQKLEEEKLKKREEILDKERKRNAAEKKKKEWEIKENIRRQNANRKIRQEEEIRLKKEIKLKKQKAAADKKREEEIKIQQEENLRKRNIAAAKKKQVEKARKDKEELENLRKQNEKKRIKRVEKIKEQKEAKEKTVAIKRVNYSTSHIITSINQYPVVRKPLFNSVIRSYRIGRNNRKGYKENDLYQAIQKHFKKDFDVLDNTMLAIGSGTTPYEPDIAMISKGTKNIYIDIEIDEPYAGVSRKLTHCYPEDVNRDNYFVDRGWFVIRFSEYQVHYQIEECLHKIVKVISAIDNHFIQNKFFHHNYTFLDEEDCWSKRQAQIWEQTNYREKYLNHNFKPFREIKRKIETKLTKEEQIEENLVKPRVHSTVNKTNTPLKRQTYTEKKIVKPTVTYKQKEFNSNNYSIAYLIEKAINNDYTIEMKYTNWSNESSLRKVSDLEYTIEFMKDGYDFKEHFKGFCHKRNEERSFKLSRINYMKILN